MRLFRRTIGDYLAESIERGEWSEPERTLAVTTYYHKSKGWTLRLYPYQGRTSVLYSQCDLSRRDKVKVARALYRQDQTYEDTRCAKAMLELEAAHLKNKYAR